MARPGTVAPYTPPSPRIEPTPRAHTQPALWLCLRFPDLPLESRPEYEPSKPQVITVIEQGLPTVLAVSPAASALGVRPHTQVHAATALVADLRLLPRDAAAEQQCLQFLATLCGHYTPTVSLLEPDALLLELRASLRMFGGLSALLARLQQELNQYSYVTCGATAVTPMAANLLARAQVAGSSIVTTSDQTTLRTLLGPLPATLLATGHRDRQKLQRLGIKCLRDLWRLPRDGLAQRFGLQMLTQLDRLLGNIPDPRPLFSAAKCFSTDVELEFPSHDSAVIWAYSRKLLLQMLDFLRQHNLAAGRIQLCLKMQSGPTQNIEIGSREPCRDLDHWSRLFEQSLPQQQLPAPVQSLCLFSQDLHADAGQTVDWLQPQTVTQEWSKVLDTLAVRLKKPNRFLCVRADHRPERAWRLSASPVKSDMMTKRTPRPLWLLPQPKRLHTHPSILNGPERIEAGWWDGEDCCRDYYIAAGDHGEHLWVFRDLKQAGGWYLHGLFA